MKYEERLTQWAADGASLILDNPTTAEEARQQVMVQFKKACIKLAELEDKIERGELVLDGYCNEERKQAVKEIAEKLRDKEFSVKIGSEWVAVVKSRDIVTIVEEVCGE